MKRLYFTILMIAALALTLNVSAQTRKEIKKEAQKEMSEKVSKEVKKQAKQMIKEGWIVAPGPLPLERQLDRSYKMQYEYDESGYPTYIMAQAQSISENYDAGRLQAMELAKQDLAGQIQTEVTVLIESQVANEQLSGEQAASITKTVSASKNLISQGIGRVITVVEAYRVLPNKNKEVLVRLAYNSEMAMEAAKRALKKELELEAANLGVDVDKIFDQKMGIE
jgi:hypothetical protein